MTTKSILFNQLQIRKDLPDIRSGDIVRVYQKIKGGDEKKSHVFEGIILARKHGRGISATFTVRRIISGVGLERTFPLNSPLIEKIEVVAKEKTRRAKLYFLRGAKGKRAKLKRKEVKKAAILEIPTEKTSSEGQESGRGAIG